MSKKLEDVCRKYFSKKDTDSDVLICGCGKELKKRHGTGWTNLYTHLRVQHDVEKTVHDKQTTLEFFGGKFINKKANNIFSWLEWICLELRPFSFVESSLTQKYTTLQPISKNTFMKYLGLVTRKTEEAIARALPTKFALLYDGWSSASTHYVGIMASFPKDQGHEIALLAFSPLLDETTLGANQHIELLNETLQLYGKSTDNVEALIADNCEVNKSTAEKMKKPMIGCASHRFQLSVNDNIADVMPIIVKVHNIMTKLRTLKLAAKLRNLSTLRPMTYNATRWGSSFAMISRYREHKVVIQTNFALEPMILEHKLSPQEDANIESIYQDLKSFNSVTLALQRDNLDLSSVRLLIDETMKKFKRLDPHQKYLVKDASIVKSNHFENGVVKIIDGMEADLTMVEKLTCGKRKMKDDSEVVEMCDDRDTEDFASKILQKRAKNTVDSDYCNLQFLKPSSNLLERFFSSAGFALSDLRQSLTPVHFEQQLFLKANKKFWGIETVTEVLQD